MKKTISKNFESLLDPCKYKVDISFSFFDVITGEELNNLNILIDDKVIDDYTVTETEVNGVIQYIYRCRTVGPKTFILTVEKTRYFPFSRRFISNAQSIFDEPVEENLGHLPLLSEIKSNAVVLTWGEYPSDLDAKIINPDGTETSVWNRKTFYSIVDIDDTASYGPETISFSKWTDWNSKYRVAGTFNYRVNWYKSGNNSIDAMGANVKLFLDPENPIDFDVRNALNGKNRQGADWVVFDIDYKSILDIHQANIDSLITADFYEDKTLYIGRNDGEVRTNRNTHLERIFKSYDFIYAVFDSEGNEISTSDYTITKNISNLCYDLTGAASNSNNTVKFYLTENFKNENLPYYEVNGSSKVTYTALFTNKLVPFVLYDRTGIKIKEVNYRYDTNYVYIYIDVRDRQYSMNNVTKYKYVLGIDDEHNYSEFKDTDGVTPSGLSSYDSFLYQSTEEMKNVKFIFDDEHEKFRVIGNLSYNDLNLNYKLDDAGQFDIHILPYTKNVQYRDLSNLNYPVQRISSYVNGVQVITTQKNAAISKKELIATDRKQIDMNSILVRVTSAETGEEFPFFSYRWDKKTLNVSFYSEIDNVQCNFEFLTFFMEIPREEFKIKKVRSERPNIYFGTYNENNEFIETDTTHYYSWDADFVKIYFLEEPNIQESNEVIKLINYFKIYQFNVYELNYFTKTLNVNINLYNYDDQVLDVAPFSVYVYNEYEEREIPGQKNPIYWANINLYKYSERYTKYILDQSKCESSYYGYQKTSFKNGEYAYKNSHVNLNPQFTGMQSNIDFKASIITKFLKNNKYEIISLYNDNDIEPENKITVVNDDDPQTLTYNLLYPYVNFFGNFYDVNGNRYSDDYIRTICQKAAREDMYYYEESNNKYFPILSYKISLVNSDEMLSGDLSYEYKCPEIDMKYGYLQYKITGYYWGYPQYNENALPYYQFMFKHSAFRNYSTGGYEGGYNPYLESIYPGRYKMNVSLYKMIPGVNGQNNSSYYAKYDESNPENYNFGEMDLTKENESTLELYDYKVELPLITVSGCVINTADNSLVYGQDLTVEFINKEDETKSRKFIYDCYFASSEDEDRNWTKQNHNKLNQSFLFKLFGYGRKYLPYQNSSDMYNWYYSSFSTNAELKHHEPGIPSGTYKVKVYYKDTIFTEIDNFEVTKEKALNGELSSLVFESPLINFNGNIVDVSGNVLGGENWTVSIFDTNDNLVRNYRYAYSLNESDMWYRKSENVFNFENLPLSTSFDLRHDGYDNMGPLSSEWSIDRQMRYALNPGTFNVKVKYKNKFIKTFPMTFTKEKETNGEFKNVSLNLGEVLKDFNIKFIDTQINEPARMYNHGNDFRSYIRIYDENYDGDITDDQFNGTNWGTDYMEGSYTFAKQFTGYYRLYFFCRHYGENGDKPKILDIVDAETNESIYERKEDTGALYDLVNLGSDVVKSSHTYNILLDYWYGGIYFTLYKKEKDQYLYVNNDYIYNEFVHQNIDGLKYTCSSAGGDSWPTLRPVKTGNYVATSYLKTPDGNLLRITEPTNITIKQWRDQDFIFRNIYNKKYLRFIVFGKCGDQSTEKVYKLPNQPRLRQVNFSESLNGAVGRFSYYTNTYANSRTFEVDHFIDGLNLYYSFGDIDTKNGGGTANAVNLYKLSNDEYELSSELEHLDNVDYINYSEFSSSYVDILSNGKFQIENLKDGGTYVIVVDKYYINARLQIRDSRGNNSSLNYTIIIYDSNNNVFSRNFNNTGYWDLGTIPAGKYKVKVYYQGIDVTPVEWNNIYKEWFVEMGTLNIDLDIPLQTFTSKLVYPGPNGTYIDSNGDLAVNVTKLRTYDGTQVDTSVDPYVDTADEITYYFQNREGGWNGTSNTDYPWTSSPTAMDFPELMPGLYKVKIFYHYFLRNLSDYYYDDYYLNGRGGAFYKRYYSSNSENLTFPLSIPKSDVRNTSPAAFDRIGNLDLLFVHEYTYTEWYENNSWQYVSRCKWSTGSYSLDLSNENYLTIRKNNGVNSLKECIETEFPNIVNSSNRYDYEKQITFCFGDLLKTFYILVNDNGAKIIQESDLQNYNSLKNETSGMNTSTIGEVVLPYIYLDRYTVKVNNYPWSLHCNNATRMKIVTTSGNDVYHNSTFNNYWGDWSDTFTNYTGDYYPAHYAIKSGLEFDFKYMRGDYVLGQTTTYLYTKDQHIEVNAVNIGSFKGYIFNKSLNRRVNHSFSWSIYEESDSGNAGFVSDQTLYYNGTIDASASGEFNFTGLFLNDRIKVNISENNPSESYTPTIKMIDGNISGNIEIPYEMYKITVNYKNNKNDSNSTMPTSGFTLVRNQDDGFDLTYKIGSGSSYSTYLRSGKYTGIIFEDNVNGVRYEYEDFVLNKDIEFTFRHYCETSYVTVNFGGPEFAGYILKVYDEKGNLYLKKTTPITGTIGPLILLNITYTFEKLDPNENVISRETKKLTLEEETINL